ncbi:MAG: hypothetical protein ABSD30_14760 [Candidatus Binatus sp.]|jgi:hypothetical protein
MGSVQSLERAIAGIKTRVTIDFLKDSPKKLLIDGKFARSLHANQIRLRENLKGE